jgi:pilus assembly protein Flp/PilA
MTQMISTLRTALVDRKGVTAAEYAVLAAGIVLAVSAAAALLGPRIATVLGGVVP